MYLRNLCLVYEANGVLEKSCDRVWSILIKCHYYRRGVGCVGVRAEGGEERFSSCGPGKGYGG